MASYVKFEQFVEDLAGGVHDLLDSSNADVLKLMLVNSPAPNGATHGVLADLTEISAGNGYAAGGEDAQNSGARSGGTFTLTGTKIVWTASGGTIGPFRYPVLYNDTPVAPADPLVSYWDYGSSLTLNDGETFTVKFNGGDPDGSIFTLV